MATTLMTFTEHPRLLARVAGTLYLIITAFALFAYLYVRGQVIVADDLAKTAANFLAHEQLYRLGFTAAAIVVICNLPMGFILFELLKVVNPRLALLALLFITASAIIEAVNLFNYIEPLFTFSLPAYRNAFDPDELQALAAGPIRMFGYAFSVSLTFFGVFCVLIGILIFQSRFLPAILGLLMIVAGVTYWINSFRLFLALPIPYLQWVTLVAELSLALWLLVVGVNEVKWRARVQAL
ncbi:MAG TPA: DUF4386 domain-containing protein [Chthoniobacterales bacterium]|jgi:hypothetical protein|nr:DUF4386 domain-containing protein [Chthoniobacterales bacterium]